MGNYMTIKCPDIANGPGCRLSIFLSGCDKRCQGCFNEEAWDFDAGRPVDKNLAWELGYKLCGMPIGTGITILGGEPLHPRNLSSTGTIVSGVIHYHYSLWTGGLLCDRERVNSYVRPDVAIYTGYTFEELFERVKGDDCKLRGILRRTDILVDGPFIQELKDISLVFRGSSNQRILDSRASLDAGKAIWTTRKEWLGES